MGTVQFRVRNVRCGGCVSNIQKALGSLPGVTAVEVDIPSGEVRVSGEQLHTDVLAAKTAELGYPQV